MDHDQDTNTSKYQHKSTGYSLSAKPQKLWSRILFVSIVTINTKIVIRGRLQVINKAKKV